MSGSYMTPLKSLERNLFPVSFNHTWQILGPFQIGTREAIWGADPLEYLGGFRSIPFDPAATFYSSLTTNGTAHWNITKALQNCACSTSANTSFSLNYSNVDWQFLRNIYGWAAAQYQAWARGEIIIAGKGPQRVIIHIDAVLEYWIDDEHYFGGDFYSFRKAPPVLELEPGTHIIELRLIRDVRAFGGISEPTIEVSISVQKVANRLELSGPGILVSDVIDGRLASSIASVNLRNSGQHDIEIVEIRSSWESQSQLVEEEDKFKNDSLKAMLYDSRYDTNTIISVGQTRPVAFRMNLLNSKTSLVNYTVVYKYVANDHQFTLNISHQLRHKPIHRPQKITFLHPGGMASYAMLRPPAKNASCHYDQQKLPILFVLHGAGLEVDDSMVADAFDPVPDLCSWILFPTGVTPWSGDDWHSWGFADVEAAVKAIPYWIDTLGWNGPGVDTNRWIVTGHSNGGQGAWYALTHYPDKVLAAAPVSGYSSIQKYVPYELWQPADPRRIAVASGSLNNYRHEMLISNARGIPIQQQHGTIDDNVPTYNSRFLAQQLFLANATTQYAEIMSQGHWWQGIMTTTELVSFYYKHANSQEALPRKLKEFSMIVGDPGDMGSKSGITVTALMDPGQYGKVDVKGHLIRTSNILSLEFDPLLWNTSISLDEQPFNFTRMTLTPGSAIRMQQPHGKWLTSHSHSEIEIHPRRRKQMGSMSAILRTEGPFIIRYASSTNTSRLALQISRNLHQYFQADTLITSSSSYQIPRNSTGNIITLAIGSSLEHVQSSFPVRVGAFGVLIRDDQGRDLHYGDEARGAAFLRPLEDERLDLVLWGADYEGLQQACRLVPSLTGAGQPDFVVLGNNAKWKGIEGALALGFFDSQWKITSSSVIENR